MFKYIRQLLSAVSGRSHQLSATSRSPHKAEGYGVVMRFQGRFTCGCTWPKNVLAPEECPNHPGAERVYKAERTVTMENVQVLAFPDDPQEAA